MNSDSFPKPFALGVDFPITLSSHSALKQQVAAAFDAFQHPVYRYLVRVLNDRDLAEDLTQEVFLRLYAHLHKGETLGSVRAWIFRVAHNLAIDAQRRSEVFQPLNLPVLSHGADAERELLEQEQYKRLNAAVTRLSAQEKRCLELRAEGLSYQQIAGIVEMRLSTLAKFMGRIIEKLMREVADV